MKKALKFILGIFSFILFAGSLGLNISNMDIKETLNIALADGDTTKEPPEPIDPSAKAPVTISCANPGSYYTDCVGSGSGCIPTECSYC